jgi:hypothetical protein
MRCLRTLKLCPSSFGERLYSVREVYGVLTLGCDATFLDAHSTVTSLFHSATTPHLTFNVSDIYNFEGQMGHEKLKLVKIQKTEFDLNHI